SVEEIIDEVGKHPLIVQRYGRPVSYDDVLPALTVMARYMTGQRPVTIQIGSQSMQMTPETPDDFWIMNPEFIKLRIDGKLLNEKLYYFWRRVESDGRRSDGRSNGKDSGNDGSEPAWDTLINHEGRQKGVVAYLGAAATWEAVASNPKAKFIKKGALPSRELVRLGVLTVMPGRKKGETGVANEVAGRGETGTDRKPSYRPRNASLEEFSGYVPASQLTEITFEERLRKEIRQKGAPNIARAGV
ncbi:hypothetical protein HYU20_01735, partial [Candidatus Woesearchaeota archaeon]|nr:hypothetical protein [Candidatus Woesearchaeota archaeon]